MSYLPCKNPNCNTPSGHPNCRCYAMAEGGSVGLHKPGCAYFAEGGQVAPSPLDSNAATAHLGALKLLQGGTNTNLTPESYAEASEKGISSIARHIKGVFSGEKYEHKEPKHREVLKKYMAAGGLGAQVENPQAGVRPDALAEAMPQEAAKMGMAKGSVYNYLNNARPISPPGLPFDVKVNNPGAIRQYNTALDVAAHPLSALGHVQNGTLTPEHVKGLEGMYPDLYTHLSQKLTEAILEKQVKKERPKHSVRQSLTLFLGAPMDSTLTQPAMAAAQSTFIKSPPPAPSKPSKKKPTKQDDAAASELTADQASQARSSQTE